MFTFWTGAWSFEVGAAVRSALDGAAVYLNGRKVGNLITQQQNQTAIARGQSPAYI